jgi:anti-anti-sigma factor
MSTQHQMAGVDQPTVEIRRVVHGYRDGVAVLALVGEHDLTTAATLTTKIEQQVSRDRGVVVSLTETEFIDSSIMHALYRGDQSLMKRGRRLILHVGGPTPLVDRALELGGLLDQLIWTVSLDDAVVFAAQSDGGA